MLDLHLSYSGRLGFVAIGAVPRDQVTAAVQLVEEATGYAVHVVETGREAIGLEISSFESKTQVAIARKTLRKQIAGSIEP